jgi:flagellin
MTRINTNLNSLTAQHNLYNNQVSLQTSLERLSTGLRINSGKDDPSGLIASSVFGSEVVTVGQAITNSQRANNIVATADAALSQVSTLLNDIRGLVQASANKGALSSSEIAANQVQVDSAIDSIDRIGQTTVFGGDLLLNGSKSFNVAGNLGTVFNSASDIQVSSFDPALHTATPYNDVKLQINQSATKSSVNLVGTSSVAGAGSGLSSLSLGTSTRTTDTLTTTGANVGSNTSLNDLSTTSTRATRTITGATITGLVADSGSTIDVTITGNVGSKVLTGQLLKGTSGIETLSSFASLINANASSTGVTAAVSGGNVVLTSNFVGTNATSTVSFANYSGAHSSSVITTSDFNTFTGSGAGSLTFKVTGSVGNANISADASIVKASGGATYLQGLINAQTASTGVSATIDTNGNILLTNSAAVGATAPSFIGTIAGADAVKFTADANTSTFTGAAADAAAATANGAVGVLTAGTNGSGSTLFTITGNKGTAVINTAQLTTTVAGNTYTGNDAVINNASNSGANAFAALVNTRTATTGVTASVNSSGNIVLASGNVGTGSLASITAGGSDTALTNAGGAANSVAGVSGSSNTTTLQLTGDLGNAVITINNDSVINDSGALVSAINAVTGQTGITATGSGAGANVVLNSQSYGSTAKASIQAIAASNSADISLVNSTNTQQSTVGLDAQGTVTDGRGSGQFTALGALISYTDGGLSFTANSAPSLAQPTAYTTTIKGSVIGTLTTSTAQDTLKFHIVGSKGSSDVTVNAKALQADSRVLNDAINAVSLTTGVLASTSADASGSFAGQNIVLTAAQPGATGTASIQAVSGGTAPAADLTTFNAGTTFINTTAGTNAPSSAVASFDVTGGALFQIGPEVNFQNQVDANITALDTHLLGRNSSTTGDLGLHDLRTGGAEVLSNDDLTNAAAIVDQAINQIATLRGQLGALQANVLESNISSQQTALEQVTSAQSSIQDADFAQETANLTRAQVLIQAGTSVLSIANQQPQSVLALLPRG